MKYVSCLFVLLLAGCAVIEQLERPDGDGAEPTTGALDAPPEDARTVEEFDITSKAERQAAANTAGGGRKLGRTVASLGDPTMPGFWIMTPLVSEESAGRLEFPEKGTRVDVTLLPSQGGSARVSLAALRLLQAPLADLSEIDVFIN